LDNTQITDDLINILCGQILPNLSDLSLRGCSKITSKTLYNVLQPGIFLNLKKLWMDSTNITLPKGSFEKNRKILMSICNCKNIDSI